MVCVKVPTFLGWSFFELYFIETAEKRLESGERERGSK